MWVQLKSIQQISVKGIPTTYRPGDWVDVGRQQAINWLASGSAWIPSDNHSELLPPDCGILILGGDYAGQRIPAIGDIKVEPFPADGFDELPFSRCLIWDVTTPMRGELLPVGFNLLDKWDAAVPMESYTLRAYQVGREAERTATQKQVFDLRVPLYHVGLIFVRRSPLGSSLIRVWRTEQKKFGGEGDERLAFLRAYFSVKPKLCALPVTWHDKSADNLAHRRP